MSVTTASQASNMSASHDSTSSSAKAITTASSTESAISASNPEASNNTGIKTESKPYVSWLDETAQPNDGWCVDTKFMREYKRRSRFLYISDLPGHMPQWHYGYLTDTLLQCPLASPDKDNGVTNTVRYDYHDGTQQALLVEYGDWREMRAAMALLPGMLELVFDGVGVHSVAEMKMTQQNAMMEDWDAKVESGEAALTKAMWRRWQQEEVQRVRDLAEVDAL